MPVLETGKAEGKKTMRQDKLTTKFQQALADAQTIALGNDNQIMEDVHLLAAFFRDADGSTKSLLQSVGSKACSRG